MRKASSGHRTSSPDISRRPGLSRRVAISRSDCFGPTLPYRRYEFVFVLLHLLDKRLIPGTFVRACPEDHFREDRCEINALRRERVNQFASVRRVWPVGDDSMSDQLLQAIGQNIRRDSLVGSQELLVRPESAKHHVANNQQRPAIAQYLHRSIQRTPRAPFGAWVFARHVERLAFFTCIMQVSCCRLAFPSQRSLVAT